MLKIVLMDFDGVFHTMASGWAGARTIPDGPVTGMLEWLEDFVLENADRYQVQIFSSRSQFMFGRWAMRRWFKRWGVSDRVLDLIRFPKGKTCAWIVVDDRAIPFHGSAFDLGHRITSFLSWLD